MKKTCKVYFPGACFSLRMAVSDEEKVAGLEVVPKLDTNEGMLFEFMEPQTVTFHMGSVQYPIDVLFLKKTGNGPVVSKIVKHACPGCHDVWSERCASYVVEVNGGSCDRNNIKVGSRCKLSYVYSV